MYVNKKKKKTDKKNIRARAVVSAMAFSLLIVPSINGFHLSMYTDVPAVVEITDEIILYWDEPDSNGAAITRYSIYQRVGNEWKFIGFINDIPKREYVVEIEKGKVYEFVVTATNKYGESSLEENVKWIQELSGRVKSKQLKRML